MEVVYDGKTNRLLREKNRMFLEFKDTLVGDVEGKVDPGGDFVVGRIEGKGEASAKVSAHFFKLLGERGVETHFVGVRSGTELEIRAAERIPLEVIYRALAYGSFLRRYGEHVRPLAELGLVEFNLKSDGLGDPMVERRAIVKMGIASAEEVGRIDDLAVEVAGHVGKSLDSFGLKLVDMKLEFGRADGKLLVIDSLSGDTMRVYDPAKRKVLDQLELAKALRLVP